MRVRRPGAKEQGFTLLELLIVVAIIGILVTMVITTLGGARKRAQIAVARSNIQAIKAALSMYESDTGRYPRRGPWTPPTSVGKDQFQNDIAYAYAALRNRATPALGGGPNSPYLEWKPEQIGIPGAGTGSWDDPSFGTDYGSVGVDQLPVPPGIWATPIPAGSTDYLLPTGPTGAQDKHTASSTVPYAFLDPWGNPYEYVEWASVPTQAKDKYINSPNVTINPATIKGGVTLQIHDPAKFDIWSWGPNGVNEGGDGAGDDVASWSDVKK